MRVLDEGVASTEDIDTAMTLGYRHPVGPLRTTDVRDNVAAGELGRQTGKGFYQW
jgi:3-hydroxybutyryl-CoA dehydrogenase